MLRVLIAQLVFPCLYIVSFSLYTVQCTRMLIIAHSAPKHVLKFRIIFVLALLADTQNKRDVSPGLIYSKGERMRGLSVTLAACFLRSAACYCS